MRTIVFWDLYLGPLVKGNETYQWRCAGQRQVYSKVRDPVLGVRLDWGLQDLCWGLQIAPVQSPTESCECSFPFHQRVHVGVF